MKGVWFKVLLIEYRCLFSKDWQSLRGTPLRQLRIKIGEVTTMQYVLRELAAAYPCAVVDAVVDCTALFVLTWFHI